MPRRSKAQRARDLETISRLYLQGWTQRTIAQRIGVCAQTINKDLAEVRTQWMASAVRDFDEAKAQELARIDALEATAWEAWEKSLTLTLTYQGEITEDVDSPGDPRFLAQVERCVQMRVKVLGFNAPDQHVATVVNIERPLVDVSDEELIAAGFAPPGE